MNIRFRHRIRYAMTYLLKQGVDNRNDRQTDGRSHGCVNDDQLEPREFFYSLSNHVMHFDFLATFKFFLFFCLELMLPTVRVTLCSKGYTSSYNSLAFFFYGQKMREVRIISFLVGGSDMVAKNKDKLFTFQLANAKHDLKLKCWKCSLGLLHLTLVSLLHQLSISWFSGILGVCGGMPPETFGGPVDMHICCSLFLF